MHICGGVGDVDVTGTVAAFVMDAGARALSLNGDLVRRPGRVQGSLVATGLGLLAARRKLAILPARTTEHASKACEHVYELYSVCRADGKLIAIWLRATLIVRKGGKGGKFEHARVAVLTLQPRRC